MSKIAIVSVAVCLTFVAALHADNVPPGLQKKGGVPPGLQKKGGLPPGQAKKQAEEQQQQTPTPTQPSQVAAAPAPAVPPAPAPNPSTPVAAPQPPPPAPSAPAKASPSNYELKNRIDKEVETIKDRIGENDLQTPALREISRLTGVPVGRLEEQRKAHGAGYPALLLGNLIAKQSNASFPQLMAARKTEKEWSTIAVRYHVPLQPLLNDILELKRHLNQVQQRRS